MRAYNNLPQPNPYIVFSGLRMIVAYSHSSSQYFLVSTVFGTVSSLHPTSFFIGLAGASRTSGAIRYVVRNFPFTRKRHFNFLPRVSLPSVRIRREGKRNESSAALEETEERLMLQRAAEAAP